MIIARELMMNDLDVRTALKEKLVHEHKGPPNSVMLEEMHIPLGGARIDIAVVNGSLHGYEIKSDRDTLARLVSQIGAYTAVFDHVTLVVSERHVLQAI